MDDPDLDRTAATLRELDGLSDRFAASFTGAMERAVRSGRSFEDTLRDIALSMSNVALQAGLKPLEAAVSNTLSSLASAAVSSLAGGFGGGFGGGAAARTAPGAKLPAVNVSIQAADPAAFAKSQAAISATLAKAVGRARRTL